MEVLKCASLELAGRRLEDARRAAGITIEQLAEVAGVHKNTIYLWQSGVSEAGWQQIVRAGLLASIPPNELMIENPGIATGEPVDGLPYDEVIELRRLREKIAELHKVTGGQFPITAGLTAMVQRVLDDTRAIPKGTSIRRRGEVTEMEPPSKRLAAGAEGDAAGAAGEANVHYGKRKRKK